MTQYDDAIKRFRQFCMSNRLTLDELNETSWRRAEEALSNYLNYNSGYAHHSQLIDTYNAYMETIESVPEKSEEIK